MRVSWDEDDKVFIIIPSLDDMEEIKRLGAKYTLPDVAVVAMILNQGLAEEDLSYPQHRRLYL